MPGIQRLVAVAIAAAAMFGATSAHAAVLYDQTDSPGPGTDFAPSNDFASDAPAVDDWTADDFTVPAGQTWTIDHVDVLGHNEMGSPPDSANVFIWADASGMPGAEAFRQLGIPGAGTAPSFSLPVSGAPGLAAGRYWLSVEQAGADLNNYWSWGTRTIQTGDAAMYRIGIDGDMCGGNQWDPRETCFMSSSPDQLFKLSGTTSAAPPPVTPPVNPPSKQKKKCKKKKKQRSAASAKKKCKKKKKQRR